MKKHIGFIFLLFSISLFFTQCSTDEDPQELTILEVDPDGASTIRQTNLSNLINSMPYEELSTAEKASILFMREEEKLAYDVYSSLYALWNVNIFQNISNSERSHSNAVLLLIDKYSLNDPADVNPIGVFANETLQQLYDDLMVEGSMSLVAALKVGAKIEEIDILDLINDLENVIDNQDIKMVYENLYKGSRNHLRAYVRNLDKNGISYIPEFLPIELFQEIIDGSMETGQ